MIKLREIFLNNGLIPNGYRYITNAKKKITSWANLPDHGVLHLHLPSTASQVMELLKLQSHLRPQLWPKYPKSHFVSQKVPVHPGAHVHAPVCGLQEPSLRQVHCCVQSFPHVLASHGLSQRCPFHPIVQKHCPVSELQVALFSHPHFCEQSWPNVPWGQTSSQVFPWYPGAHVHVPVRNRESVSQWKWLSALIFKSQMPFFTINRRALSTVFAFTW